MKTFLILIGLAVVGLAVLNITHPKRDFVGFYSEQGILLPKSKPIPGYVLKPKNGRLEWMASQDQTLIRSSHERKP